MATNRCWIIGLEGERLGYKGGGGNFTKSTSMIKSTSKNNELESATRQCIPSTEYSEWLLRGWRARIRTSFVYR